VRQVLAGHARLPFGRGTYRAVKTVGIARVPVEDLLGVLLVIEVVAIVEVSLLGTLRPRRSKQSHNPTRGNGKRHGYSPHYSSHSLGR
jgi:hypothetical protein